MRLANLWRTTGDIAANWKRMQTIGFENQLAWRIYSGPGHWNDADMMVIGHKGLIPNEQYTHMTLWCLLASPLLLGFDVTTADDFTLNLLTNDEELEVDQDSLGQAAGRVAKEGDCEVWAKKMADGSCAAGLFNRGFFPAKVTAKWADIGASGPQRVRDLWLQKHFGTINGQFDSVIPRHGCVLIRIWPAR